MMYRVGLLLMILISMEGFCQEKPKDSVSMPASLKYADAGPFKKLFFGSNYRDVWEEPVKASVFYITRSGFTIEQLGGGQQTRSLRLKDNQGREWVLRSVDKDVSNVLLPSFLPKTFIHPIIQDITSAAFPYSPIIVYELANSLKVVAARPELVWIADDPGLGEFRELFANTYGFLEQREPTPDNTDTKSTKKVLENLMGENDHLVIQKSVLQARLLDMLVADWDRHADQWRWDKVDTAGIDYYYGIPRDRDQAFFLSNGLVVKLARIVGMRQLVGFQNDLHLKRLNKKSWTFDRTFLNGLGWEEWQLRIKEFQSALTDAAIDGAVKKLPPEIYRLKGESFTEKLKKRRNDLGKEAFDYYEHISKVVVINGTPDDEFFYFQNQGEDLELKVIDRKSKRTIYLRKFKSPTTWKIIVSGNGGNDNWLMSAATESKIRVEIQGGAGKDVYQLKGNVRTVVVDSKSGTDVYELAPRMKRKSG